MNIKKLMGSDRPGHMFAAIVVGSALAAVGYYIASPWLMGVGLIVITWEWACTPDVDYAYKRRPKGLSWAICGVVAISAGYYASSSLMMGIGAAAILWKCRPGELIWAFICTAWLPYSWVVPTHRSKYSHSLRYGLLLRFFYAALVVMVPGELLQLPLWEWMVLDVRLLLHNGQWIVAIALLWQRWSMVVIGCIIADVIHLAKDGYTPDQMLFGRQGNDS